MMRSSFYKKLWPKRKKPMKSLPALRRSSTWLHRNKRRTPNRFVLRKPHSQHPRSVAGEGAFLLELAGRTWLRIIGQRPIGFDAQPGKAGMICLHRIKRLGAPVCERSQLFDEQQLMLG